MAEIIERGKQQVLFNYLPGRTFDFKKYVVAKVEKVRGQIFQRLNASLVIRKISEQARAWPEEHRPLLRDDVLHDEFRFVFIDPSHVTSEIFPLVFWCSNSNCKKVFDFTNSARLPRTRVCPRCNTGRLNQLRFIKVHQCGNIEPLTPWSCPSCHSNDIALDDRGSERLSNFRWKCLTCGNSWPIRAGSCRRCSWPNTNGRSQEMSIEVFRSNKTFYVHSSTLINIPEREYDNFFNFADWYIVSTAKYLGIDALNNFRINDYVDRINNAGHLSHAVSEAAFGELLEKLNSGEITVQEYTERIMRLRNSANPSIEDLKTSIRQISGIDISFWETAKYDVIDTIIPNEIGSISEYNGNGTVNTAVNMGISKLILINDFPIIVASYGFSRLESRPFDNNRVPLCNLNPFPADREQGGRYPVYVDKVQADAILIQLNPLRVINWLELNGYEIITSNGERNSFVAKGYFINLFNEVNIYNKIFGDQPIARLVLSLVHTYSHLAIRQAALLCGLDKTSITEYVLPKTLTFAIYCNHRFGATIGALTALFEQSIEDWLQQIETERRCIYDPVCHENGGNCHSCTHLSETSCRLFNQNLGRIYLFGGYDSELQRDIIGYFDPRLPR